jgi:hypothetical protein
MWILSCCWLLQHRRHRSNRLGRCSIEDWIQWLKLFTVNLPINLFVISLIVVVVV